MSRSIPQTKYLRQLRWCDRQGWTEPFYQDGQWYAFPPGAVMPLAIPPSFFDSLQAFFRQFGLLFLLLLLHLILIWLLTIVPYFFLPVSLPTLS